MITFNYHLSFEICEKEFYSEMHMCVIRMPHVHACPHMCMHVFMDLPSRTCGCVKSMTHRCSDGKLVWSVSRPTQRKSKSNSRGVRLTSKQGGGRRRGREGWYPLFKGGTSIEASLLFKGT